MPLKELTAKQDRCGDSLTCPGVYEDPSTDKFVIIGAKTARGEIANRIGDGEVALQIDRNLVRRAIGGPVSRFLMRAGL